MTTFLYIVALMAAAVGMTPEQCNDTLSGTDEGVRLSEDGKLKWIDGLSLPLEGKAFADAEDPYRRVPKRILASGSVNRGVWAEGECSSGMLVRFHVEKSARLLVRWDLLHDHLHGGSFSPIGKSGLDFYTWNAKRREWRYGMCAKPTKQKGNEAEFWVPQSGDVMIYLPLYNGTTKFEVGVEKNAVISPVAHRVSGVTKPIVFYGTSITQGGCVSRAGLAYPAVVSRRFDAPHVNLGFAGNGRMEMEMAELMLEIDAGAYVVDCLWNMDQKQVEERFEPFLRRLKAARPDVPILTLEECVVENAPNAKSRFIRGVVEKLKKEDAAKWANLVHLPAETLFFDDGEGTVDRCHPNDWGTLKMSDEIFRALKGVLCR